MQNEPAWLPIDAVIQINQVHCESAGECHALLFYDKLESAVARPKNLFLYENQDDVLSLGVKLMFSVAEAHAFEQGNKRTGFTAGVAFMHQNGFAYDALDVKLQADLFLSVVVGDADQSAFEDFMWPYLRPHDE